MVGRSYRKAKVPRRGCAPVAAEDRASDRRASHGSGVDSVPPAAGGRLHLGQERRGVDPGDHADVLLGGGAGYRGDQPLIRL
jgi:hypothetical protein